MRHTLVAAFATLTDANRTRGDLMSRGIAREQIHAIGAESADIHAYDAPYTTTPDVPVDRTHHESKVTHFFKSLFGHEPHETHRHYATAYPDAVRRGALVIAVDVDDEDQLANLDADVKANQRRYKLCFGQAEFPKNRGESQPVQQTKTKNDKRAPPGQTSGQNILKRHINNRGSNQRFHDAS